MRRRRRRRRRRRMVPKRPKTKARVWGGMAIGAEWGSVIERKERRKGGGVKGMVGKR